MTRVRLAPGATPNSKLAELAREPGEANFAWLVRALVRLGPGERPAGPKIVDRYRPGPRPHCRLDIGVWSGKPEEPELDVPQLRVANPVPPGLGG